MSAPHLYHFTCTDGYRRIGRYNCLIIPQGRHPVCGWSISWFTTEPVPDKEATGLAAVSTTCDRMAHRYVIEPGSTCVPWLGSRWRQETPEPFLTVLEEYGDTGHWWVADVPVHARWDWSWAMDGARVVEVPGA
jgi:hypothetical protein